MHRPKLGQERRNHRILVFAVHTSSHNQKTLQMSTYKYSQKKKQEQEVYGVHIVDVDEQRNESMYK